MRSSIRRAKNWSRLHPQGADTLLTAALSILALVSSRAAVDFAEAAGPPGFDLPTLPSAARSTGGLVTDVDPAPEYLGALSLRRPPARLHRRRFDWASMVA